MAKMRLVLCAFGLVLACTSSVFAQTPATGTERIGFDQEAPDLATVQAYRVDIEVDGVIAATGAAIICTGSVSPFVCSTPFPAMTPGQHSIRARVSELVNGTPLVSEWSAPWVVIIRVAPPAPTNLRLVFIK